MNKSIIDPKHIQELANLKINFENAADREIAQKQENYMKNLFPFFGIQKPLRAQLSKEYLQITIKNNDNETILLIIKHLFSLSEREYHYVGIDLLNKIYKKFSYEEILEAVKLINEKSWWDSVDTMKKAFSCWLLLYPEILAPLVHMWLSGSMWERRMAIIVQLGWKEKTNLEILSQAIIQNLPDKEFFIQKSIGWSLREYSKTSPQWTINFVDHNKISGLAKREALKNI